MGRNDSTGAVMAGEWQALFNLLGGLISGALLWMLKTLWSRIHHQSERISALEVLVAGKYVTRDDYQRTSEAMFAQLRRIEDKLDRKADKE